MSQPENMGAYSLVDLNLALLLEHMLAPRLEESSAGAPVNTTQASVQQIVIDTLFGTGESFGIDGVFKRVAKDPRMVKRFKEVLQDMSPEELVSKKIYGELEQTVTIIAGCHDGIHEPDAFVAVLSALPCFLQIILLAYKEPMKEELDEIKENGLEGFPRTLDFGEASSYVDLFEKLYSENRFTLKSLKEMAIDGCGVDAFEDDEEDPDPEGVQEYYYWDKIMETLDNVVKDKLKTASINEILKSMEVYKQNHGVMLAPFLVVRIDTSTLG